MNGKSFRIAIVLSRFNDHLGNELLENTQKTLIENGVLAKNITLIRVPGALEIPLATQFIAQQKKHQAIIALGIVVKGKTAHFQYVCEGAHNGLMEVSLKHNIPVVFGILAVNKEKEAKERVSKNKLNKGKEYAETAIEMAILKKNLE